jgi:hypothetical protein
MITENQNNSSGKAKKKYKITLTFRMISDQGNKDIYKFQVNPYFGAASPKLNKNNRDSDRHAACPCRLVVQSPHLD